MQLNKILFVIVLLISSFDLFSQSAAEILKQPDLEKQLDYILENTYKIRTTNLDTGLYYINYAIELAQQLQDKKKKADAYRQQGVTHYYRGNFEQELASYQVALKIAEEIEDKALQGNILLELGLHFNRQKQLQKSIEYQKNAESLCRQTKDMPCVASALRNRGRVYLKLNYIDSAEIFWCNLMS